MAAQQHSRKLSSRAGLPRRTTKGPLDADDDIRSISQTAVSSPTPSRNSRFPQTSPVGATEPVRQTTSQPQPLSLEQAHGTPVNEAPGGEGRDLSFLLDASIYHSLSQLEVPGPFRRPFLPPPASESSLAPSLELLDVLLSQCDFLRAAQLAGAILTSGIVQPTDDKTIFRLLAVRYSCLELSGNLLLAAQEAKALEDLSSAFYYDHPIPEDQGEHAEEPRKPPHHIVPFSLRLQALRLQSIGFSDPRRGVTTLYDAASECREHLAASATSTSQRALWTERLQEVSIRVVNALIEMGDLDCAARTLETIKPEDSGRIDVWTARMILLRIKIGDISRAHELITAAPLEQQQKLALASLLAVAEGQYDLASENLSRWQLESNDSTLKALIQQNLAVAYLYKGEVQKARQTLEELVDNGFSFQTLTINLATVYDLTSDRSRALKTALAAKIADQQGPTRLRSFANADFKL